MLKHFVGKGRHVMKQLHVCLIVLQYDAIVATERTGYVLYRALVFNGIMVNHAVCVCVFNEKNPKCSRFVSKGNSTAASVVTHTCKMIAITVWRILC